MSLSMKCMSSVCRRALPVCCTSKLPVCYSFHHEYLIDWRYSHSGPSPSPEHVSGSGRGYSLETRTLRLHPNPNPNVTSWLCGPQLTTTNRGRCKRRVPVSKPQPRSKFPLSAHASFCNHRSRSATFPLHRIFFTSRSRSFNFLTSSARACLAVAPSRPSVSSVLAVDRRSTVKD